MADKYLQHFGIKGMRWGVRRFQNEDGTLTDAGKNRYGSDVTRVSRGALKKQISRFENNTKVGSGTNTEKGLKKIQNQYESTEEYKKVKQMSDQFEEIFKQAESQGISRDRLVFSGRDVKPYLLAQDKATQTYRKIFEEHKSEMASAMLKDLGYEDSDKGRKYIERLLKAG